MPRLLLVDDNPSIHRIAESLLAPTAIELVCVDSAAEALERIQNGERFDVAMVDTAMPGMDGWTLVERLRGLEATARMPIALMAGVLDPVDPHKLERAPIQGFLKKPIELRELADRVNTLMATPVGAPASAHVEPLATQPISREEAQAALASFPDFTPTIQLPDEEDEDLLILTAADLFPEEASLIAPVAPAAAVLPAAADLELEELDLDGLHTLTDPMEFDVPQPVAMAAEPTRETPPLPELDTLGADELAGLLEADLGPSDVVITPVMAPLPEASINPELEEEEMAFELPSQDLRSELRSLVMEPQPVAESPVEHMAEPFAEPLAAGGFELPPVGAPILPPTQPAMEASPFAESRHEIPLTPAPAAPVAMAMPSSPTPAPAIPMASDASAQALVQALVADPQAMAQLTKALVAHLGEEQLKAIAWEVFPDLARKLS